MFNLFVRISCRCVSIPITLVGDCSNASVWFANALVVVGWKNKREPQRGEVRIDDLKILLNLVPCINAKPIPYKTIMHAIKFTNKLKSPHNLFNTRFLELNVDFRLPTQLLFYFSNSTSICGTR